MALNAPIKKGVPSWSFPTVKLDPAERRFNDVVPYLAGGKNVSSSSKYGLPLKGGLTSTGKLNLGTSGSISVAGSIAPTVNDWGFSYTATTTSITFYWDGTNGSHIIVIRRADGTRQSIPVGSITISGLTASTTYGFLPFWAAANMCSIGWVTGDSGSPLIAWSGTISGGLFTPAASLATVADGLSAQVLLGREQLSAGFMTVTTPGAGTGSGSSVGGGIGGGGAAGHCVMLGTDIEPLGDGGYSTKHYPQSDWVRLQCGARSLNCTPDHPIYHADKGKIQAREVSAGDWLITVDGEHKVAEAYPFTRVCTKVEVIMPHGHLFWANGFLSHNSKALANLE